MTGRKIYRIGPHLTEDNEATPEWTNEPQDVVPRGAHASPFEPNPTALGTGFASTLPTPELAFDRRFGAGEPFDAYQCSPYWVVSRELKDVLLGIDAAAFDVVETKTLVPGKTAVQNYWLVELVQFCDCLDEERSRAAGARAGWPDQSVNLVPSNSDKVFFNGSVLGTRSFFKLTGQYLPCLCTEEAKHVLESAGVTNLRFDEVGNII